MDTATNFNFVTSDDQKLKAFCIECSSKFNENATPLHLAYAFYIFIKYGPETYSELYPDDALKVLDKSKEL